MQYPTFSLEQQLTNQGYSFIAGLDEVGRGAWAGPVVAACVIFPAELVTQSTDWLGRIRDSKTLSAQQRSDLNQFITDHTIWGIGESTHQEIDEWGISQATKEAMGRALTKLNIAPDCLLIDGREGLNSKIKQQTIIDGDSLITSIAAASIIAKVYRDQLMTQLDDQYPGYFFRDHVGYGTKSHQLALAEQGISPIHRRSYRPVKAYMA